MSNYVAEPGGQTDGSSGNKGGAVELREIIKKVILNNNQILSLSKVGHEIRLFSDYDDESCLRVTLCKTEPYENKRIENDELP